VLRLINLSAILVTALGQEKHGTALLRRRNKPVIIGFSLVFPTSRPHPFLPVNTHGPCVSELPVGIVFLDRGTSVSLSESGARLMKGKFE
jgi:hypothetical protein